MKQQNDFIITPEMKRSRSPIIVRVTMSQKDKSVKRIDDEQQGGTAIDSKKPLETNVDDVAPPEYDSAWANDNRTSQLSFDEKQNIVSVCRADDTVTAHASIYGYNGDAAAIATKSPLSIGGSQQGSPQQTQTGQNIQNLTDRVEKRDIYDYGGKENKAAIAAATTTTRAITGNFAVLNLL
uniref:Uncharacterized protein n=1 Tax=Ascaris lumbricoides TaxID=6252 RepID=A0A0M3HHG8_ASCLU